MPARRRRRVQGLEILAAEPIEHAPPELRVAADAVVCVGPEFLAVGINPAFLGAIAQVLPDCLRTPVLLLLRDAVAALEHQDAGAAVCQRARHGSATGAAPDDDDVVVGHRPALAYT